MKSIVFLYAGFSSPYVFEKAFNGKSAFEIDFEWACKLPECGKIVIAASESNVSSIKASLSSADESKYEIVSEEAWNTRKLLSSMESSCGKYEADYVVYTSSDRPFLDEKLSLEVIDTHKKYLAEYTSADGYPAGFAPEVIDGGAVKIISELSGGLRKEQGEAPVTNGCIFNIMKGDINAFDIEAVIAPEDYRLYRFDFSCGDKINFIACRKLYENAEKNAVEFTAEALSAFAKNCAEVQKTVPAFYNVQIAWRCASIETYSIYPELYKKRFGGLPFPDSNCAFENMKLEMFKKLIEMISNLSDNAVVSLSFWGEPLLIENIADYVAVVLEKPGLSVLIETDGIMLTQTQAESIANVMNIFPKRTNGMNAVNWIVKLDAFTEEKYLQMHNVCPELCKEKSAFETAKENLSLLNSFFPSAVYAQFTRVNENEDELEKFFRFYKEKTSPSGGNVIIQKYDHFCRMLPERKPADLSPVKRNPCWHLKRDICIFPDGSVPMCREDLGHKVLGNVFVDGLETLWNKLTGELENHIKGEYCEKCRNCDEYYTFNF